MPSSILNSDDGVISGTSGLKSSGGDDGVLVFQSKGTETARINTDKQIVAAAGTASLPALTTTGDVNTGIFFPAADTIAFAEGGAEAMRINSSGNVGIGTNNPLEKFVVAGGCSMVTGSLGSLRASSTSVDFNSGNGRIIATGADASTYAPIVFASTTSTTYAERWRINSNGYFQTGNPTTGNTGLLLGNPTEYHINSTGTTNHIEFNNPNGNVGKIQTTNSATAYVTSSDYRLKENIAPMTGALATVVQLKPRTYTWKVDGSAGQGFIAHELQEVVPECVTGEKDAVKEDGSINPQGVDTSFLVATLTAAIQELKAELDEAKARIAALEAVPGNE